ncbi:MAG: cobyric acid synthase CobQ, partial [Sulfurimonadaceae bacterium]
EGVTIIEEQFKLKVLGVIPYRPFNLGFEDAQSIMNYTQNTSKAIIKVGVIRVPHISNFTDFEPLIADNEINLQFVQDPSELEHCDLIIIPGTKRTIHDLIWLREKGFETALQDESHFLLAICGGYEMMFETLCDPLGIEEDADTEVKGFGRFRGEVHFVGEKTVKKTDYTLFDCPVKGYEIHNGHVDLLSQQEGRLYGTFVHGLLDSDLFRAKLFRTINPNYRGYDFTAYKAEGIADFAHHVDTHLDLDTIIDALYE